jgi:hypothetical protein
LSPSGHNCSKIAQIILFQVDILNSGHDIKTEYEIFRRYWICQRLDKPNIRNESHY